MGMKSSGSILALAMTLGIAGTVSISSNAIINQPAHAFGFGDIVKGAKKVGGAVNDAAKAVAKPIIKPGQEITKFGKLIGQDIKNAGKQIKASGKLVGARAKKGASTLKKVGGYVGGGALKCMTAQGCGKFTEFKPPSIGKQPPRPWDVINGRFEGKAALQKNNRKGANKALPRANGKAGRFSKKAPTKRLRSAVIRDRSLLSYPIGTNKKSGMRDRSAAGRPVGLNKRKNLRAPVRGITKDNLKPSRQKKRLKSSRMEGRNARSDRGSSRNTNKRRDHMSRSNKKRRGRRH